MWGAVVRNCREWIRLVSVFFPRELLPPAMAYVQACPAEPWKQCCLSLFTHVTGVVGEAAPAQTRSPLGWTEPAPCGAATLSTYVRMGFSRVSDWGPGPHSNLTGACEWTGVAHARRHLRLC